MKFVIIELGQLDLNFGLTKRYHTAILQAYWMNSAESHTMELYWDATYAIAVTLMEVHPELQPENVGLLEIATLVEQLSGFADDPNMATERILLDIQNVWYEETHA